MERGERSVSVGVEGIARQSTEHLKGSNSTLCDALLQDTCHLSKPTEGTTRGAPSASVREP